MDVASSTAIGQNSLDRFWVIVLAGGDGARVRALTRDSGGTRIPKQFYAPRGGSSMVRWALDRARALVPADRVVAVVASQHRSWWAKQLDDCPPGNIVVQPENRGTAVGLLLPVLEIMRRDPQARLLVLPSDHHVRDEGRLRGALLRAARAVQSGDHPVVLLGMVPEACETGYGWIVPEDAGSPDRVWRVADFTEKPDADAARALLGRGGVLNSFIMAATGQALVQLYDETIPGLVERFSIWRDFAGGAWDGLRALYEDLPAYDFSRAVLQNSCRRLSALAVPDCGWIDLGTPDRLQRFWAEQSTGIPTETTQHRSIVQCA